MAITRNREKMETFCKETKTEMMDMLKKFVSVEDILAQPETAFAVGKCIELYDKSVDLIDEQARQLDEMSEYLENSYRIIQKLEDNINDLRKEVAELRAH